MSSSVASGFSSSRVGRHRKFNINDKFMNSPYLSNVSTFNHEKRRRGNSPKGSNKSPRRRHGDTDAGSVATRGSGRSQRTSQTYRRASTNSTGRMMSMKNFLLPREVDKLLRGFRQKHSNHPILTNRSRPNSAGIEVEDDTSTIASDFAMSIDDEAVFKHCIENEQAKDAIFSGPLLAAITIRNSGRNFQADNVILPPVLPVVAVDKGGDVSDLESVHSDNVRKKSGRLRRKKR